MDSRVTRFIWLSTIPALLVIAIAFMVDHEPLVPLPWLAYPLLLMLAWVGEEYRVKTNQTYYSLTAAIHLPLILLCTPLEALTLAVLGSVCSQLRRRRTFYRVLYNGVVRVIGVGATGLVLAFWRLRDPQFYGHRGFLSAELLHGFIRSPAMHGLIVLSMSHYLLLSGELLAGCTLAMLLDFTIDSGLIATVVAIQTQVDLFGAVQANMRSTILPEITKSVLGIIAACVIVVNPFFTVFVALPLAVAHVTSLAILRLERETVEAITSMADAIDYRDPYTAQHSVRVAELSSRLARRLGLSTEQVAEITLAARVHDLGKMGIPNDILLKNGPLTAEEMAVMQQHPRIGAEVLQKYRNFHSALPVVLHHHERYDGKGYPDGLAGTAIPLGAQIVAHADTFDAMTSDRPYRKGMRPDVALQRLGEASGTQFDPAVAGAFVAMLREELAAAGQPLPATGGSLAQAPLPHAAGENVRYLYRE